MVLSTEVAPFVLNHGVTAMQEFLAHVSAVKVAKAAAVVADITRAEKVASTARNLSVTVMEDLRRGRRKDNLEV
jgi:hypothetical protein